MRHPSRLAALLVPLLLNTPLWAADPDDDEPAPQAQTQWMPPVVAPPTPTAPSGTSEGDYANPDRRRMDEDRRRGVLDQLCRHLRLSHDFSFGDGNFPRATVGVSRRMEADFDNSLVLLDEEKLQFDWNLGKSWPLGGDGASGSVSIGAGISNRSIVARRLGTFSSCDEIRRLIDVTDIKVVVPMVPEHTSGLEKVLVPVSAESINAMGKGELWRIPLTVNLNYGAGVADAAAPDTTISFGYGKGKNGVASMTVWRLSEKQARFRFRVDFVQVQSKSAGISKTFAPIEFNTEGGNFLSHFLRKEVARQLHRYTSAYIGMSSAKSDGRRLILEYVIDPTNPQEAAALAEALKGNFWTLLRYARKVQTEFTTHEDTLAAYENLERINSDKLGEPHYAARSEYGAHARSFTINLPFIINRTVAESFGTDSVTRFTDGESRFDFHSANRSPNAEYFNAPFLGPIVKDLESRNVDVITYAPGEAGHQPPIAVYIHNQGFLRVPVSAVGEMAEDANSILRLTGAARTGREDPTMAIPVESFMPPSQRRADPNAAAGCVEPADQKGWLSFTLVMNQKAIGDAMAASTSEVLKAFARSVPLGDRTMAEWLAANGRLDGNRLTYDESKARIDLGFNPEGNDSGWLAKMSGEAAGLARDLADASAATTPEGRADALAKAFSHENTSGLRHRDILRVLVQFMDPLDLTGDFVSASDGTTKRAVKVQAHYQLKQGRAEVPMLKEAGETRGRFADGSVLTD